jgi:hypothetical protein
MRSRYTLVRHLAGSLLAPLLVSACADLPSGADHAALHVGAASRANVEASPNLLKSVRAATARFSSTAQARKAGYLPDPTCVAVPSLGGMGHHWVNPALVDPVFDPLHPEVVLYSRESGDNVKLVAVEYIVIDVGQAAPTFDGHPFDVGGTPVPVPHWSLHVWVHQQNPNGVFAPFNPTVTCPS